MKIRIVKTEAYNVYSDEKSYYYKLQFLRRFLFWTYWGEPTELREYGLSQNNFFSRIEDANTKAERIIKTYLPFTETVVKEISSE